MVLAAVLSLLVGQSSETLAEQGEAAFAEGVRLRLNTDQARPHFHTAAHCFEEIRRRGASNPILYRNLGHAHLLAGELPEAILAYRRGLRLDPANGDLQQGLSAARAQVVYAADGVGWPPDSSRLPWLPRLRSEWLLAAAVVFYLLGCLALTRWLMTRRPLLFRLGVPALLAAVVLTVLVVLAARVEAQQTAQPLVVITEDGVVLRKGNGLTFPPRCESPLNRGVEARLLFQRGDWLQIELATGEVGWVPGGMALVDRP
jgi:hypothetical protein